MNHDESSLIARMRADDADAFSRLYHRYSKDLVSYLCSIVQHRGEAEEIMHDAYVSLWSNRHNLRNTTSVRPFLLIAARNSAFNILRARRQTPVMEEYSQSTGAYDVHDAVRQSDIDFAEYQQRIMGMVHALPLSQRRVVMLSRFEEKSHKEICEILDLSLQTVKNALSMALRTLRDQLCEWELEIIGESNFRGGVNATLPNNYILYLMRFIRLLKSIVIPPHK